MRPPLTGLRYRLAAVYVAWFGSLLAAGAVFLALALKRSYRAEIDRTLERTLASARDIYSRDRPEFPTVTLTVAHVVEELIYADRAMIAFDSVGRTLGASRRYPGAPDLRFLGNRVIPEPVTIATDAGLARIQSGELSDGINLLVGISLAPIERQRRALLVAMGVGLPILLVASAWIGVLSARPALRPIRELADAAVRAGRVIDEGGGEFPAVPPPRVADEIGVLATELNRLFGRLHEALQRERSFLADAAHELRTPIAIIRSEAEASLGAPGRDDEALRVIASEADRMGSVVGDLLLLARGGTGESSESVERFYLDDAVSTVLGRVRRLPAASGRTIRLGEFEAVPVSGSRHLIERALLSLIENALVHAEPSPVEVSTGTTRTPAGRLMGWIRVRDWGPGIAKGSEHRVFERYGRGTTGAPGSGLGLTIARWVAEQHGGTLSHEAPPEGGAAFKMTLPLAID